MRDLTSEHNECISVRFAPSPTGHLHIGGIRTALFNWLLVRQCGGKFFLRIEDTDKERSQEKYEIEIIDSLKWLGLNWDGEIVKQSERINTYLKHANKLVEEGLAYKVDKETPAVKFSIPKGKISFYDHVYGQIEFDSSQFDDFIIIKSDGFPTWLFSCVIDDGDMGITHVIRGEDHISNTPRQILLARALGFNIPQYAHLPLIFGNDGTPLSKRHGTTSLNAFRERGYCEQGLLNYLALLGWGPSDNKEFFMLKDLIRSFSLKGVSKTNAVFDEKKLNHINALHLKEMNVEEYCSRGILYFSDKDKEPTINDKEKLCCLLKVYKERIECFSDLYERADYFFNDCVSFETNAVNKYLSDENIPKYLMKLIQVLQQLESFDDMQKLEHFVRSLAEELGIKAAKLIHPIRVSITGKSASPGVFDVMSLLGKDKVLLRLKYVVDNFDNIKHI